MLVLAINAIVGDRVPPPLLLKRRFSDKRRTRALPDDDGTDVSRRNLLLRGIPVEMFVI